MPSLIHEAPIELIRQNPALAVELLRAMTDVPLPAEPDISLGPTDLTDVVPAKYLADAVVVVSDAATGAPVLVVIVEPQGRDEPAKEFSWPVYITAVRRAVQCRRAFLLVICPDPGEAEKCRRIIRTGHPGFDLAPRSSTRSTPLAPTGTAVLTSRSSLPAWAPSTWRRSKAPARSSTPSTTPAQAPPTANG